MGTLFECLREARLEKYYPSFRAHGITRSENLTRLTVHDCVSFGINSAEDKRRLVELINIVKAVHNTDTYSASASSSSSTRSSQNVRSTSNKVPRKRNRSPAHSAFQVTGRSLSATNDVQVRDRSRPNAISHQLSQVGAAVLDLLSDDSSESESSDSSDHSDYEPAVKHSVSASVTRVTPPRIRKTPVEKVKHGQGYNYGVPGGMSASSGKARGRGSRPGEEKIKVCVRKRPLSKKEIKSGEEDLAKTVSTTTLAIMEPKQAVDLTAYTLQHEFIFDEVFDEKCSNEDVYIRAARPLISCIFDGGSATCFAYGQTGAGKTHTMIGDREIPGLYLLAAHDIFSIIESGQYGTGIKVWVSFFEIYCGQLFDLLNKRNRLHAREDGAHRVCLAGLTETEATDESSLMQVLEYGNAVRSKGSTGVNPDSSRSHAVLQLEIRDRQDKKMGRISFIDLAGSERASDVTDTDKQTRMEGAEINQSLLALKECIRSIDQESRHKPFRQSKLTHILKDSFVGNSRTCMIANISPAKTSCEHTLNTLRYADRVKELRKSSGSSTGRSVNVAMSNILMNIPASAPTAPSLFQPSNILCSSTPMRPNARQLTNRSSSSELHLDPSETPLRGPGARRKTTSVSKSTSNQRSSVSSSVAGRSPVVRHTASRQNESSHSESDQTDTDSNNVTGLHAKLAANQNFQNISAKSAARKVSSSQNIPVVKSTDTDNDFPTTDFNNDVDVVQMNDLNRTGGKKEVMSETQTVASSVPVLPAGLSRATVTPAESGYSSQGQISSVSASTPVLRQKEYTEKQTTSALLSDGGGPQRLNDVNSSNTGRSVTDVFPPAKLADPTQQSRGAGTNLKGGVSGNISTSGVTSTVKTSTTMASDPTSAPRPPLASTLMSSFEDDLLFGTPSTVNDPKKHTRTPSDSSTVFSPNSTRTQPKVPQDPSSDPEIPAVLPAKSSDLTTFSQWAPGNICSPRWLLHNQNQDMVTSGIKQSVPIPATADTGSGYSRGMHGLNIQAFRDKAPQTKQATNPNGNKEKQFPSREVQPNFKYPIPDTGKERNKTNDREGDHETRNQNPSSYENQSAKRYSERHSDSEGSPLSQNFPSGEPISANWFLTPADHDTHVARSVSKKQSSQLEKDGHRATQNISHDYTEEQTCVKNIDAELPESLPISRTSPKNKSVQSDSGIASDNTGSASKVSRTGPGKSLHSSYFPPLDFTNSGARPKYNTSTSGAARVVHSPVQNRQAMVSSPVSKEILPSHSPVVGEVGDSISPTGERNQNSNSPVTGKTNNSAAVKTEKLQAGSVFSPIHPQPVTTNRQARNTIAVSKDIVHPTPVSQSTSAVGTAQGSSRSVTSRSSDDTSIDLKSQLISAHEDQLATVTSMCKQEMKLLLGAKAGNRSFSDYMEKISEVLSQKMSAIQLLQDQIMAYQLSTQDASM